MKMIVFETNHAWMRWR